MPWDLERLRPAELNLLEREEQRRASMAVAALRAESDELARTAASAEARGRTSRVREG